jgi:type II secretory pathway component PulC
MRRPKRRRRRAPFLLFFLCLFLGIFVYLQTSNDRFGPTTIETATIEPAKIPALPVAVAFQMPPIEDFSETLDRPLFSKIRRPPAPEPDAPAPEPEKKQTVKVRLAGVVISPRERVALVQEPRVKEITRLREGQEIEGWVLERILPDRIVLRFGELREEVKIEGEVRRAPTKRKKKARSKRRRPRSRTRDANPPAER